MDARDKSAWKRDLLPVFPQRLGKILARLPERETQALEEIRVRAERPLQLLAPEGCFIRESGESAFRLEDAVRASAEECGELLGNISQHSLYALEQELKGGYISLLGGYRVGLCGKPVVEGGKIKHFVYFSSFCIRIAREHIGSADEVLPYVWSAGGTPSSVLVLSPPRCGKTTVIRDLARQISYGTLGKPCQVCIVDERSEIAGSCRGIPQNDVGPRTDVLDACPKAEGMSLALRALSPDVLITDEIGREEDRQSLLDASNAGVAIIASAHSSGLSDAMKRPVLRSLLEQKLFERIVILGRSKGAGTLEDVLDGDTFESLLSGAR